MTAPFTCNSTYSVSVCCMSLLWRRGSALLRPLAGRGDVAITVGPWVLGHLSDGPGGAGTPGLFVFQIAFAAVSILCVFALLPSRRVALRQVPQVSSSPVRVGCLRLVRGSRDHPGKRMGFSLNPREMCQQQPLAPVSPPSGVHQPVCRDIRESKLYIFYRFPS